MRTVSIDARGCGLVDTDLQCGVGREVLLERVPPHSVVAWDNDYNIFGDVTDIILKAVLGMTVEQADAVTLQIHEDDLAIAYRRPKEQAETVAARIVTIGLKVAIEPA